MQTQSTQSQFEQTMLPHLDAAYNLARWLTGNDQDAEDIVQDAYLRAFRGFDTFHGDSSRTWLLTIVRNTCYTWLRRNRIESLPQGFDEESCAIEDDLQNSERLLLARADHDMLREALEELPPEYREAIVWREMEGLSYKEIAQIAQIPLGTVMSRLARARQRLQMSLTKRMSGE